MTNKHVDATLLRADASWDDVSSLFVQADRLGCAAVCVYSRWLIDLYKLRSSLGATTRLCTVVGFPHGNDQSYVKSYAAYNAVYDGADEVDMVIDIPSVLAGNRQAVIADIEGVKAAMNEISVRMHRPSLLKVIIETDMLDDEQIVFASKCCRDAGADYVKTSTGMAPGGVGATVEDIRLIKAAIGDSCLIKASGGIKDLEKAQLLLDAGADRLGLSAIGLLSA